MCFAQGGRRAAPATLCTLLLLTTSVAALQQDSALEVFEDVDPYTGGKPEALQSLGYVSFGPFYWAGGQRTEDVRQTLGDIPMLFVETAHFRIASTLATYDPPGDRMEKEQLEAELAKLKKKLPRTKLPRKLDPWLRLHLYAQNFEDLYTEFCARFGLKEDDFLDLEAKEEAGLSMGAGPYLGQKEKFTVLLSQNRSAYGRFVRRYLNVEDDFAYRYNFADSYFYGASFEAIQDNGRRYDIALRTAATSAVVHNLLDAFRDSKHAVPLWFTYGLSHWYGRRVDPRWSDWGAGGPSNPEEDSNWIWEPRVRGLVKNEACLTWEEMMAWREPQDVDARDHMIAWSRVDWILDQKAESLRPLLLALSERLPGEGDARAKASVEQQTRAFAEVLHAKPAELDEAWREWVLRTYPKK